MSGDTLDLIIVLVLVVVVFAGFIKETISPDIVAMAAVGVLLITGILSIERVLSVFSNAAPITIACMLVLSTALERTGVIEVMGRTLARHAWQSSTLAMAAMTVLVALTSAFMNNTPVVVILTPVMIAIAHTLKLTASKILIPLSFASIFGGMCTLIGTSTNLLVDGVARAAGQPAFGMFEITLPGAILAVIGIVFLITVGQLLLPERKTLAELLPDLAGRKFLAEVLVPHGSPLIGKSLTEAGLTTERGFQVLDVIRDHVPFNPEFGAPILKAGDRLVLRTKVADVMQLRDGGKVVFDVGETRGLDVDAPVLQPISSHKAIILEGILGPRSRFVGRRVADLDLRQRYDVRILAIHRQNESLHRNLDETRLAFGDTVLLEGPPEGLKRLFDAHELVNLTEPQARPYRRERAPIACAAFCTVMVLATLEVLPIAALALIGATLVVALGCVDVDEAYGSIPWPILMLIFAMLALGEALNVTGAAFLIVGVAVDLVAGFGPVAVLSLLYLLTSILTAVMSNNATAILLTPLALGLAEQLGVDPRPFLVAIMFAASASFATPIGYQTNTFVYAAGGYRFVDFVKIGLPLSVLLWIAATIVLPLYWGL